MGITFFVLLSQAARQVLRITSSINSTRISSLFFIDTSLFITMRLQKKVPLIFALSNKNT